MFKNVKDAIYWIENSHKISPRQNLSRMELALDILQHPEKDLKIIHIAGTNGKGSVSQFVKNILMMGGYNVGCFVSPYVISFNERIQYNYANISDSDLLLYANTIFEVDTIMREQYDCFLTFFEILTLIAVIYFYAKEVNYAILEVGLGGLLDPTNFCNAVCSAITNIGYDHMNSLGTTLPEIALNKLGIIKEGNHLITTVDDELHELFNEYLEKKSATVKFITKEDITIFPTKQTSFSYDNINYDLSTLGFYQAYNASLAIEICKYIDPIIPLKKVKKGLLNTLWVGRMEPILPNVILDGSHNIHGVKALSETIKALYPDSVIVFSCLADKESDKMVNELASCCEKIIITEFDYYRCKKAEDLFESFEANNKELIKDYKEAIDKAIDTKKMVFITGSLYFISAVRKYLKK